jgi:hypothetical protein
MGLSFARNVFWWDACSRREVLKAARDVLAPVVVLALASAAGSCGVSTAA